VRRGLTLRPVLPLLDNTGIPDIIASLLNVTPPESRRLPILGLVLVLASGLIAPPPLTARGEGQDDGPILSDMRAHLFQNKTAKLSENILDPKNRGLWNSVAGPDAANAMLIVVEVSGRASGKYSIHLVARETGRRPKLLLDSTQAVPFPNEQGKTYLPFLVHQSGCAAVQLRTSLVGVRPGKPLERTIAFACGE
jgi:hypothetical protein